MTEEWREVIGEPNYLVSSYGRIRSKRKGILSLTECQGYQYFRIYKGIVNGKQKQRKIRVHVAVMLAFIGPRPNGMEIRHLNGDSTDNHLTNLLYGTKQQNEDDKILHGTRPKGETQYKHKLTEDDIRYIRSHREFTQVQLAEMFHVGKHCIEKVRQRKSWKHVE